jgi:hypothetical protein
MVKTCPGVGPVVSEHMAVMHGGEKRRSRKKNVDVEFDSQSHTRPMLSTRQSVEVFG